MAHCVFISKFSYFPFPPLKHPIPIPKKIKHPIPRNLVKGVNQVERNRIKNPERLFMVA